ncbi:MAG: hypothetical protein ACXVA9_04660 [Bdellovibrionales bacterium]
MVANSRAKTLRLRHLLSLLLAVLGSAQVWAETPVAEPFVLTVEEMPAQSIHKSLGSAYLDVPMVDGREAVIDFKQSKLLLKGLGHNQEIQYKGAYPLIMLYNGDFIVLREFSPATSHLFQVVHLPSGQVTEYDVDPEHYELAAFGNGFILTDAQKYRVGDAKSGKILEYTRAPDTASPYISPIQGGNVTLLVDRKEVLIAKGGEPLANIKLPIESSAKSCMALFGFVGCFSDSYVGWYILGGDHRVVKLNNQLLVSANDDLSQGISLNMDELGNGDFRVFKMSLADLKTGELRPLNLKTKGGDIIHYLIEGRTELPVLMTNKFELRQISHANMWRAIQAMDTELMFNSSQLVRKFDDFEQAKGALNDMFGHVDEEDLGSDWTYVLEDQYLTFWKKSSPLFRSSTFIPLGAKVKFLGMSDYMVISLGNSNVLLDMNTHRAYDLGLTRPPVLTDDGRHLIAVGNSQWVYSLDDLGKTPDWRQQPTELYSHTEVSEKVISTCQSGLDLSLLTQPMVNRLLQYRFTQVMYDPDVQEILSYKLNRSEKQLFAQALQRVGAEDMDKLKAMFRRFKLFNYFEDFAKDVVANPCLLDPVENVKKDLDALFAKKDSSGQDTTVDFYAIQHLIVFGPYLKTMGYMNSGMRDLLSEKLARGAAASFLFADIFFSKLNYLTDAVIAPIFGEPRQFKIDVTDRPLGKAAEILLLSTFPTTGERVERTAFGIYLKPMATMQLPPDVGSHVQRKFQWRSQGLQFEAAVDLTKTGNLADLIPKNSSFDYSQWRKRGSVTGLMMMGTNLGQQMSDDTLKSYRSFFEGMGYRFSKPDFDAAFLSTLARQIGSGELDYLIKEAHSDGDEKNMVRAPEAALVYKGVKVSKGMRETIYLVTSDYGNKGVRAATGTLISNQNFGEWLRQRPAPLFYLNTSCNSYYKVRREFSAAQTANFVPIASTTSVYEFANSPLNTTAIMIRDMLAQKDWKFMRAGMDKARKTLDRQEDKYILPNEEDYDTYVRKYLGMSLESKVNVSDAKTHQAINIDQYNEH